MSNGRGGDWHGVIISVWEGIVYWWTCFTLAWIFTHGNGHVCSSGMPLSDSDDIRLLLAR